MLRYFYDFENNPQEIDEDLMERVYEGDKVAIADALCIIASFTHYNVPAMHRLDEMSSVLEQARLALIGKPCECGGVALDNDGPEGTHVCNRCSALV